MGNQSTPGERWTVTTHMSSASITPLDVPGTDAHRFFGSPDDLKLCSCMTLFEIAAPGEPVFREVLERYFNGVRDRATVAFAQG
jgi:uncharacterized protein (DUF1810 family)